MAPASLEETSEGQLSSTRSCGCDCVGVFPVVFSALLSDLWYHSGIKSVGMPRGIWEAWDRMTEG